MKIEERLHGVLHEYADTIEPEPGSWAAISARFDEAPSPRRRLVLAGVAIATVVVLVAALVVRDTDESTRVVTDPRGGMPSRIFVATEDGQGSVLNAATGTRENGYDTGVVSEGTQIAVSPDGRDAYVVHGAGDNHCLNQSIQRLSIGGDVRTGDRVATDATAPTVSLDGRYLAFLGCAADARDVADRIVLRDLVTGEERVTPAAAGTYFSGRLEFAADSRHVLFGFFGDALAPEISTLGQIDVVAGEAPPGRDLGVAVGRVGWVGIRGETGDYLGVKGKPPSILFMHGPPWTAGPQFTVPDTPTQVVSDRSGRHILVVVDHTLYRWTEGEKEPKKIADGVISAAWIPDASSEPGPVPVSPPTRVVAAMNGQFVVLGAQDGRALDSLLGTSREISSVSSRFNRQVNAHDLFFASTGQSGACGDDPGPDVSRMTVITDPVSATERAVALETRRIVGGSQSPAVSPDGRFVAYGIICDGQTLGFTELGTGERNFRTDPLGSTSKESSENVESVQPLGWSPDSRRLLYRLLRGNPVPHYYVGRLWPAVRQARTEVIELPGGADITAAAFIDNETVAVARTSPAGTEVRRRPVPTDSAERASPVLFEVPGRITSLVADPSGRHFLAVADGGDLYRWSIGDPAPTKLAAEVRAAAWLPDS